MMDRENEIEYWFSGAVEELFMDEWTEARLRQAFKTVLSALTEKQFEQFIDRNPAVACYPGIPARVFQWRPLVRCGETRAEITVIYFTPNIVRWGDKKLLVCVAHETAHVVLGHAKPGSAAPAPIVYKTEKAADALSASWGFKPEYKTKDLERIKRMGQEKQITKGLACDVAVAKRK